MLASKIETISRRTAILLGGALVLLLLMVGPVYADTPAPCTVGNESSCAVNQLGAGCSTDNAKVNTCTDPAASSAGASCTTTKNCNLLTQYVQPFMDFLAVLVGVAVTVSIIIGGIQYGTSAGDSAKVSAAKNRIRNAVIALIAFFFMYALLNFVIPGGLI